ncbi:MAG TPA: amino acid permease [Chthoniobacter sp.]|nr:amino acid permease [Chthoniobacter sp.]
MPKPELIRGLTRRDTTALVVGTIIGTGVFLKTTAMAQAVGSPLWVLLAWVVAGAMSLAGALAYAELGAMLPAAGGEYVYLRAAYGDLPAFLFGWMRITVGASGAIAIFGVAFATFLSALVPLDTVWVQRSFHALGQPIEWQFGSRQVVAVGVIVVCSAVNCLRVVMGGRIQSAMTLLKLLAVAGVIAGVFFLGKGTTWEHFTAPVGGGQWKGWSAFGAAVLAALWAFDGWNNMPMVAGEVRDPGRNIPKALIAGMAIVLVTYGLANLAYFYALPFSEILTANSTAHRDALPVAALAAKSFLGESGPKFVSLAFLLSAVGVLNGSILTNARIPYAMARDGLFFRRFAVLDERTSVPVAAIAGQAVWASVLAVSGTFDQLTDCVVFAGWLFYALTTSAVFVLRRKLPDAPRPYRTIGYPYLPVVFLVVALALVGSTLLAARLESVVGLVLIGLGLPVYWFLRRQGRRVT